MKYLITLTEDFGDSIEKSTTIVESQSPITNNDTNLLNYILSTDVNDPDKYVEIELIEDIIQTYSHDMEAELLIIEKVDGKFSIHEQSISINDFTTESIKGLLRNPVALHGNYLTFASIDNNEKNNTFVIDKRLNPSDTKPHDQSLFLLFKNMNLNTPFISNKYVYRDSVKNFVSVTLYYFPSQSLIMEHVSTSISSSGHLFDSEFVNDVTIMDLKGNIQHRSRFDSKVE